jgi:hypothetical protein
MAYYSDKLSQSTADGAIVLAQGAVPIALTQAVQGNILTNAMLQHRIARSISGGFVDVFEDDSGINQAESSAILYNGENKYVATDLAAAVDASLNSAGVITRQDLKGTITYWEKTSSGKGRFKTGSGGSVVTVGMNWTDGANNTSTTNCLPVLTGDGQGATAQHGSSNAWVCADGLSGVPYAEFLSGNLYYDPTHDQWWKYDFGANTPKIINKFRVYYDNWGLVGGSQNGVDFYFEGSNNNSDWVSFYTEHITSYVSGWCSWHTFVNSTPYRYYRLRWVATDVGSDDFYLNLYEIQMVEAVIYTNTSIIPGVLINDLRTVISIVGDGSASDAVVLDTDLASGSVSSIYGLAVAEGKVQPNQVTVSGVVYTYSSPALALTAGDSLVNTSSWNSVSAIPGYPIAITETVSGASTALYSATLTFEEDNETWYDGNLTPIVRLNSGTWEYYNSSWTSAPTNSRVSALSSSFDVNAASMNSGTWEASQNADWVGITGPQMAWAVYLTPDGNDVSAVEKVTTSYAASQGIITTISWPTAQESTKASTSFFIEGLLLPGDSVWAYARSDDNAEWTELSLTRVAQNVTASGIDQYASPIVTLSGTTGTSFSVQIKSDGVAAKCYGICGMYSDGTD